MASDDRPRPLPTCATPGCPFLAHSNPNAYARQRGWEGYCCHGCAAGEDHAVRCERVPVAGGPATAEVAVRAGQPRVVPAPRGGVVPERDELVWKVVSEMVVTIEHAEHEYEAPRLVKKIRDYVKRSTKSLEFFKKSWSDLVNDYADAMYEMLFAGLCGRPWLVQGEADLLLVLDAGIKEHFPSAVLQGVPRAVFEQTVLIAHDRAFEEHRYMMILDEVVRRTVEGQKMRRKLISACEAGRKEAADYGIDPNGSDEIEDFVARLINGCIARLSKELNGELDWILTEDAAVRFFTSLMEEADAVPVALTKAHPPPREGWDFIYGVVARAYVKHNYSQAYGGAGQGAWANRGKRKWGYKEEPSATFLSSLPQCATPGCPYRAHSDPNSYAKMWGLTIYCCNACHEAGEHGVRCEKALFGGGGSGGIAAGDAAGQGLQHRASAWEAPPQ